MMFIQKRITTNQELRETYLNLRFFEECSKDIKIKDMALYDDAIKEMKHEIRDYLKVKDQENQYRKIVIYGENGDRYVELIDMASEDEFQNQEEAEKYFEDNIYMHYYPTFYDCTGQLFTGWYKVFKRNGNWMVYHLIKKDI